MKTKQYILVTVQFVGIILMMISGRNTPHQLLPLLMLFLSVLLAIWAYLSMKEHTFSVMPEVRQNAELCTKGPYKIIRHPMYTSVLLFLSGLLLADFSFFRLAVLFVVTVDLLIKIEVEEKILKSKYTKYQQYTTNTKKIIPFVY